MFLAPQGASYLGGGGGGRGGGGCGRLGCLGHATPLYVPFASLYDII